jgi:hypothetical protein
MNSAATDFVPRGAHRWWPFRSGPGACCAPPRHARLLQCRSLGEAFDSRSAIERFLQRSDVTWHWHDGIGVSRAGWPADEPNSVLIVTRPAA